MADQHQLEVLRQGPDAWNTWRQQHPRTQPHLSHADLSGADLFDANLSNADLSYAHLLSGTHLSYADLSYAQLSYAQLSGAHLSGADLSNANLSYADLSYADLSGAHLSSTNLSFANLSFANFSSANLSSANLILATVGWTQFGDNDLRTVRGLETVQHAGPLYIGIDTIYRSQGDIPEAFLRKAGIPEDFITYMHSLVNHPIEYYTCLISHSSRDQDFADQLYTDLQSKGVRCWFALTNMKIGDEIRIRIDESIRLFDKLLLVLSEHSINSSWVKKEVETAFDKEARTNRLVLFPIRLDDTVMQTEQAWVADIRRMRNIGDFCKWKQHDNYQTALTRLLRDLKAKTPPEGSTTYQKPLS